MELGLRLLQETSDGVERRVHGAPLSALLSTWRVDRHSHAYIDTLLARLRPACCAIHSFSPLISADRGRWLHELGATGVCEMLQRFRAGDGGADLSAITVMLHHLLHSFYSGGDCGDWARYRAVRVCPNERDIKLTTLRYFLATFLGDAECSACWTYADIKRERVQVSNESLVCRLSGDHSWSVV